MIIGYNFDVPRTQYYCLASQNKQIYLVPILTYCSVCIHVKIAAFILLGDKLLVDGSLFNIYLKKEPLVKLLCLAICK